MNIIKIKFIAPLVMGVVLFASSMENAYAQRVVRIGEAEISVQSPISIRKSIPEEQTNRPKYPKFQDESYIGFGTVLPMDRESFMDMHYGRINSIEFGHNYFFRPVPGYAIGTFVQYSYYNYKLKDAAVNDVIMEDVPEVVRSEYYRTDNIGTGIVNRFYFVPKKSLFKIDIGAYVDFAFSKRYKVKTTESGKKEKYKFRDGEKFNPIQEGLYGAVSVDDYSLFVRYRATNLFNPSLLDQQLPDITIGLRLVLD